MSKPTAKKPFFLPPVARRDPVAPGQPGWLQAIAANMTDDPVEDGWKEKPSAVKVKSGSTDKPRPGEAGWLTSIADSMEESQSVGGTFSGSRNAASTSQTSVTSSTLNTNSSQQSQGEGNSQGIVKESTVPRSQEPNAGTPSSQIFSSQGQGSQPRKVVSQGSQPHKEDSQGSQPFKVVSQGSQSSFDLLASVSIGSYIRKNQPSTSETASQSDDKTQSDITRNTESAVSDTDTNTNEYIQDTINSSEDNHLINTNSMTTVLLQEPNDTIMKESASSKETTYSSGETVQMAETLQNDQANLDLTYSALIEQRLSLPTSVNPDIRLEIEEDVSNNNQKMRDTEDGASCSSKSTKLSGLLDKIISNIKEKNKPVKVTNIIGSLTSANISKPDSQNCHKQAEEDYEIDDISRAVIEPCQSSRKTVPVPTNLSSAISKLISRDLPARIKGVSNSKKTNLKHKIAKKIGTIKSKPSIKKARTSKKMKEGLGGTQHRKQNVINYESEIKSALLELQKIRTACTWVFCSRSQCGKWRYVKEKDPSLVRRNWVCGDNPDNRYADCSVDEQEWDRNKAEMYVENRFTVGSLVWAKVLGWPRWPAMVDDDPDTGDFFWTEVRGESWVSRPNQYHVVFFDSKEKSVSRAWISDRMIEGLSGVNGVGVGKDKYEVRLRQALDQAVGAESLDLVVRRKKFCLANRFKGPWGPIWPGWSETRALHREGMDVAYFEDNFESEDSFDINDNIQTIEDIARSLMPTEASQEVFSVMNNSSRNVSFTHDNYLADIIKTNSAPENTSDNRLEEDLLIAKKSKPKDPKDKENIAPSVLGNYGLEKLYQDKSIYTQELSVSMSEEEPSSQHTASFCSETGDDQLINSSLDRGLVKALQIANTESV